MLDAEAAVARAVLFRDALVDVELHADRAVADRVHRDLQSGAVGGGGPLVDLLRRVDQQAAVLRRVGERLEECRRVRAERAVDEAFESADAQPFVAAAVSAAVCLCSDCVAQMLPLPSGVTA